MAQYKNPYTRELLPQLLYDNLYEIMYRQKHKPKKTTNKYTHSQYWKNKKNMRKLCCIFDDMGYVMKYNWIMNIILGAQPPKNIEKY